MPSEYDAVKGKGIIQQCDEYNERDTLEEYRHNKEWMGAIGDC